MIGKEDRRDEDIFIKQSYSGLLQLLTNNLNFSSNLTVVKEDIWFKGWEKRLLGNLITLAITASKYLARLKYLIFNRF